MLDWPDMERLRTLALRARDSELDDREKQEFRNIIVRGAPHAAALSWPDLVQVAHMWLGVYAMARMGYRAAAAGPA